MNYRTNTDKTVVLLDMDDNGLLFPPPPASNHPTLPCSDAGTGGAINYNGNDLPGNCGRGGVVFEMKKRRGRPRISFPDNMDGMTLEEFDAWDKELKKNTRSTKFKQKLRKEKSCTRSKKKTWS